MRYKLGSQLDLTQDNPQGSKPDLFEWNLCLLDVRGMNAINAIPLGVRTVFDPIIQKARELVTLLNVEQR